MLLGGSLAGVLMLTGSVWLLKLGGSPVIADEADALRIAHEHGFDGVAARIDDAGRSANVTDCDGRILAIRAHGAHFVSEQRG